MFVSFKIMVEKYRIILGFWGLCFWGLYFCSCQESNSEKEEVLVRVIYDLITYDGTDVPDIALINSSNGKCMLSELIDKDKIVFYLPNLGCSSCYEQEIALIKGMIPAEVKEQVIIVGNFSNIRELKLFERSSGLRAFKIEEQNGEFPVIAFNETFVVFFLTRQMKCYALFDAVNNVRASKLYYRIISEKILNE